MSTSTGLLVLILKTSYNVLTHALISLLKRRNYVILWDILTLISVAVLIINPRTTLSILFIHMASILELTNQPVSPLTVPPSLTIILTNNDCIVSAGILNTDISDHLPLFQITPSCFLNSTFIEKTFVTRDINSNTLRSFTANIQSMDWGEV